MTATASTSSQTVLGWAARPGVRAVPDAYIGRHRDVFGTRVLLTVRRLFYVARHRRSS
jgi:hypothetical protein